MASGLVSASFSIAMARAFSRLSTSSGNVGDCNTDANNASAASRSAFEDKVRKVTAARSWSTRAPRWAPMSAKRSATWFSERPALPSASMPLVRPASPALPGGARRPPASKSTATSSMGIDRVSTKRTLAPDFAVQDWIGRPAPAGSASITATSDRQVRTSVLVLIGMFLVTMNSFFNGAGPWGPRATCP